MTARGTCTPLYMLAMCRGIGCLFELLSMFRKMWPGILMSSVPSLFASLFFLQTPFCFCSTGDWNQFFWYSADWKTLRAQPKLVKENCWSSTRATKTCQLKIVKEYLLTVYTQPAGRPKGYGSEGLGIGRDRRGKGTEERRGKGSLRSENLSRKICSCRFGFS